MFVFFVGRVMCMLFYCVIYCFGVMWVMWLFFGFLVLCDLFIVNMLFLLLVWMWFGSVLLLRLVIILLLLFIMVIVLVLWLLM